jgi:hypothetical protein
MHEAQCAICERSLDEGYKNTTTNEYTLNFNATVCRLCGLTLARGFAGIVEMLRQSHGEKRERVLSRLMESLKLNGFTTDDSSLTPGLRRIG